MATDDELQERFERAARKLDYTDYPDEAAAVREAVGPIADRAALEGERDRAVDLLRDWLRAHPVTTTAMFIDGANQGQRVIREEGPLQVRTKAILAGLDAPAPSPAGGPEDSGEGGDA